MQSRGIARWLTQQLSPRLGDLREYPFLFPQKFVAGLFDEALPNRAAGKFYAPDILTWRIMRLLPSLLATGVRELQRYSNKRARSCAIFQLAEKSRTAFDRYLAFRPRLILQWERRARESTGRRCSGGKLVSRRPACIRQRSREEFSAPCASVRRALPERVSLFGISTLPEFYVRSCRKSRKTIEVHLFAMQPDAGMVDRHSLGTGGNARATRRRSPTRAAAICNSSAAIPLLASLGKLGREFLETVSAPSTPAREQEHAQEPGNGEPYSRKSSAISSSLQESKRAHRAGRTIGRCNSIPATARCARWKCCTISSSPSSRANPDLQAARHHRDGAGHRRLCAVHRGCFRHFAGGATHPVLASRIAARARRTASSDTFLHILEIAGSRFTASSVMSILESVPLQQPLRSGRSRPRDDPHLDRENRDPLGHRRRASRRARAAGV